MLNPWKRLLPLVGALVAFAVVATACTDSSDGEASASITSEATAAQEDTPEDSPPAATAETEDGPSTAPAPEPADVEETDVEETDVEETDVPEIDVPATAPEESPPSAVAETDNEVTIESEADAVFEDFALPDYVVEAVGDDYASYFVEVEPGIKIHVLEVGSGYPVYLQHGAPTSGLLYRKVAELLPLDEFRIIMPTMVGLGFSTKVPADQHTLDNHIRWMNAALNQLSIDELIYVGHDWGGPVGMGALARSPELLQGAVVLNTVFGAPASPVEFNPQLEAVLAPLAPEAELFVAASIFDQLAGAQNDPASMPAEVIDLYRRPVAESDNPLGPLAIVRMAADGPDHPTARQLREIDTYLAQTDVPAEIVWGVSDPLLGARLEDMIAIFPNAPVTRTDAGHFLQEEADVPALIAAAIQRVGEQIEAG